MKTYGGSILRESEMKEETKAKFVEFLDSLKNQDDRELYKVFVPYNTTLPFGIIKSTNPQHL